MSVVQQFRQSEPVATPASAERRRDATPAQRAMTLELNAAWNDWFHKGFAAYLAAAANDENGPIFALIQRVAK